MEALASKEERMWATLCHLSAYLGYVFPIGNVIAPLAVWLLKREEYPLVDDQGKEALNFQISMTIYIVIAAVLCMVVIGIPLLIGLAVWDFIAILIASVQANKGEPYRYPLTLRFIN
jgi:uncharacterized Tic20 family protein